MVTETQMLAEKRQLEMSGYTTIFWIFVFFNAILIVIDTFPVLLQVPIHGVGIALVVVGSLILILDHDGGWDSVPFHPGPVGGLAILVGIPICIVGLLANF